jgi:hypothetical protein
MRMTNLIAAIYTEMTERSSERDINKSGHAFVIEFLHVNMQTFYIM